MHLNNRVLIVIVPVLLLSYCLAAIPVYMSLESTIKRFEQSRLEQVASQLTVSFNQYSIFAENYLLTIIDNSAFKILLEEQDNIYHHVAFGLIIEDKIKKLIFHHSQRINLAIIQPNPIEKLIYYFELSDSPFSEMNDEEKRNYQQALTNKKMESWNYINKDDNHPSITVNRSIDKITYDTPVRSLLDNSVIIQFSIEPTSFINLKEKIIDDYNATVDIKYAPISHNDHSSNIDNLAKNSNLYTENTIGKGLILTISTPAEYLGKKLLVVKLTLTLIALIFFLISSCLLYLLINKYITKPISNLKTELNDVISNKKTNIDLSDMGQDEIGSLKNTFHKIYEDLSRSYLKTKELAEHDPLTQLYNMGYINELIQDALVKAKQCEGKVAIVYIDLDNFKFVNDKHGHEAGDALLVAFASKLKRLVRQSDLICKNDRPQTIPGRIAGDEFSVIVSDFSNDDTPKKVAQRILSMFEKGFTFEQGTFPVSASIGIAIFPQDGHTLSQLISNADHAMYQAKNTGKNKIAFYSKELAVSMRRKMNIEHELKTFNPDDELHLVYMPLVCAHNNTIKGFEVLVRWLSKKLGFVGPDEFIPIAEASGQFNKIDSWVTENAMHAYDALKLRLGKDFTLSINLSSAQLNMNNITDHLFLMLDKYQIEPQNIQLEMTETLNAEYTQQADALLNTLCDKGFNIAIDDFGTGYTALLQLIEYPAHMIKFDKVFVDKAMQENNRSMLEPVIALCHSQNLKVTIEGVETEEMANYLKAIGADYLQGFYYGKPARLEDLDLKLPMLSNLIK
jgi:diguanylate cyclase (GGDEF)-like protein